MRSKKNVDNPFRRRGAKAVFRCLNSTKQMYEEIQEFDISWAAEELIRRGSWDEVRAIQNQLNRSPDKRFHVDVAEGDLQALKLGMIKIAKAFPKKVIASSGNSEAKNRVYIADGVSFKILLWTQEQSTWSLYHTKGKPNDKLTILTTVDAGQDKVDALMKHFATEEGRKHYIVFTNILKDIYKGVNTN
jgi:hypothetical protein